MADLMGQHDVARRFEMSHPEASLRVEHLDRQIADAAYGLDIDRQHLDGIAPKQPLPRTVEREAPRLERSPDLGLGL